MQNADTVSSFSGRMVGIAHSISHISILPWCFMTKGVNSKICVNCLNAAMVYKVFYHMTFCLQSSVHVPAGRKSIPTSWWHVFTWEWCVQRRGCARCFLFLKFVILPDKSETPPIVYFNLSIFNYDNSDSIESNFHSVSLIFNELNRKSISCHHISSR